MRPYQGLLPWSILLASIGGAEAKLDLNSSSNIVVYWGQNSFNGKEDQAQQPLAHYCDDKDIDVIPMAFNMMVNGPGGAPEIDFAVTSKDCDVFGGTQLKDCPAIGKDIKTCQKKGKTILLSIGGATYSEGGFKSEEEAKKGAQLMWETFGPKQEGSSALRPFGDAVLDGFDFDFEANVQNMAVFANEMRSLMKADKSNQKFYLTAAPQCPYPDQADKAILNGPVYIDAIWVQFYNNFCGVNNFNTDSSSSKYNFEEWDNWAKTVSNNKDVKVIIGVPAFTTAASTGYVPASQLAKVIEYTKKFESFGGVMMWDATQAYANDGFIKDVRKSLGPANDSGSSSPDPVSTSTSTSTSTDPTKTTSSPSSNAPDSSPSSSSSSSASVSHKADEETTEEHNTATATPKPTASTTAAPTSTGSAQDEDDSSEDIKHDNPDDKSNDDLDDNALGTIIGNDILELLGGIRKANEAAGGIVHALANL
ncbi:Glycoside hydrolase superfamily [Penicillium robsamsonii]|uniref:Glycoside hydrolase superfamily n=1 Tax=Penicillium robsamsonii TaxID=1792511 RepID=UPI0025467AB2|nr:Glycoside hydrolase superfamily [Penicillium robsamsonii]KAJ5837028.1 Glycoside hydrolase superfamily [Penicillium robsamsonii]